MIGLRIIKTLSHQIDQLSSWVGSLATPSIEDLSFLTGAHRVSITRAMKALKDAGKIILRDKQLILPG